MKETLSQTVKQTVKYWWVSLLVGILSIALGIFAMVVPAATLITLSIVFGWVILFSGIMLLIFAISNRKEITGWGWYLASAIIDIIIGIFLVASPAASMLFLLMFVGFAIMFQSIWGIGASLELQTLGSKQWGWLLFLGILGLILSFFLILNPSFSGSFVIVMFSLALLVYGIFRICYAFDLKKFGKDFKKLKSHVDSYFE